MSRIKAKGSTGVKYKSKSKGKQEVGRPAASTATGKNNFLPLLIIGVSLVVLVVYIAMQSSNPPGAGDSTAPTNAVDQTAPLAPPMTGVEVFNISTVESAKARVATFKLEELSGPDCVQQVLTELKKCGTIGKVRADYSNALLEVECDKTAVTDDKIIAALNAGQHPGRLTTEKIAATK